MNITEMLILSAALSFDSLGIGASYRMRGIKMPAASRIAVSLISAGLTGAAMLCGNFIGGMTAGNIVRLAGAGLILFIGLFMILSGIREEILPSGGECDSVVEKTARALTRPELIDENRSKRIELREAVYIGAAVSADSFAAGFGLSAAEWLVPVFCGVLQFVFLCAGECIGSGAGKLRGVSSIWFSMIPGVILIIIGTLRLISG